MLPKKKVTLKNKNLAQLSCDFLYHLNINVPNTTNTDDIVKLFGDVKFVCMGGTEARMAALARHVRHVLDPQHKDDELVNLCEGGKRYAIFKVGPVLCCSHGIGMSSMSVLLHELLKLVMYAQCEDPVFIRVGTSGGLGVDPGTVVVTKNAYNGYLRNEHEIAILGQRVVRPAKFDEKVYRGIVECSEASDNFKTIIGNTMAAECFYEGQGRLDGASCEYTAEDKLNFLQKCYDNGIRNIEMEATMFSSLTLHVGIRAGDVCVTLIDRLKGDQVTITPAQKKAFEERPLIIVGRYIKRALDHQNSIS